MPVAQTSRSARRLIALLALFALLVTIGCTRTHVGSRSHALELGTVIVERWDDPVDTQISWRVYWKEPDATRREAVTEIWRGVPWMSFDDPVRLEREHNGVLRLRLGPFHCFERIEPTTGCATYDIQVDHWRPCSASRRKTC